MRDHSSAALAEIWLSQLNLKLVTKDKFQIIRKTIRITYHVFGTDYEPCITAGQITEIWCYTTFTQLANDYI